MGGHGHNDILSFELFLNKKPFIVDPGSYLYSGDFEAHDRFRSTRAHNGVEIDEKEISPFIGKFRIANRAKPFDVNVNTQRKHTIVIQASHAGYLYLPDPVTHQRTISFNRYTGALHCIDQIEAFEPHLAVRRLHFAHGIEPVMGNKMICVESEDKIIIVSWDGDSQGKLVEDEVSPCFGSLEKSKTLEIRTRTSKEVTTLTLNIYMETHGPLKIGEK